MDKQRFLTGIQTLSPAYFGLPMSTGIIAVASYTLGYQNIGRWLFILNNVEIILLLVLLLLRVVLFFPAVVEDISSHATGAGFLTLVAACCLLGVGYITLGFAGIVAAIAWQVALCLWFLIVYTFFILITIKREKPTLEYGINGTWLLLVVSAQALSILGNLVAGYLHLQYNVLLFLTLLFYLLGIFFYVIIITVIFYRTAFSPMRPEEFKPSYWIDMGAAAICCLSGSVLIQNMPGATGFAAFVSAIKLLTLFFWVAAAWWLPVIAFLEIRKQLKTQVKYSAAYWSMIFPLGVFTLCTWRLAAIFELTFLEKISDAFIYIAWLAWVITFVKMCGHIGRIYFQRGILK